MSSESDYREIGGFKMMLVNSGTFKMGADRDSDPMSSSDERPVHQVTLTRDYYIGVYPVTQKQWMDIMGDNPSAFKAPKHKEDVMCPVESVSFFDVQGFISKLNEKTGKNFRLPTEAEWEYAARGGFESKGYNYSGSGKIDDVAWYSSNSYADKGTRTHAVGEKNPNELGLYDMSGNVREWVNDIDGSYTADAQTDPAGPQQLANAAYDIRVTRGGHYHDMGSGCRVSARAPMEANKRENKIGFRLALTADANSPRRQAAGPTEQEIQAQANANAAIEEIKPKVKANLEIIHAANPSVAKMMMNAYSADTNAGVDFWRGLLQATEKQAQEASAKNVELAAAKNAELAAAKKSPAGPAPAIEAIKQEVKSRIEATYGAANPVVNIMFNSFINNPEAGKLEFWQKVRESTGGEAAPLDPKRTQEFGDWNFVEDGDVITVVKYWGHTAHVDIPAQINGKPVTRIGEYALDRYDYVNSVTIPDSITTIDEYAFKGREFMRHITIPDSVTSIGECAFDGCNLLSVTLGKGLKTIGKSAFERNQLTELVIPDNVISIGESAFYSNCLTKLTIGKGLTVISDRAFENNQFVDVIIPSNIKEIGDRAFNLYRGTRIVADSKFKLGKDAFGHAKIISSSDYAKEMADAEKAAKKPAKKVDEKSKIIDLSDDNPPPCGRGWTFAKGVYTIQDWANVTVTGDNKKSGRRIVVPKGTRKVNITLKDAVMWTDTPYNIVTKFKRDNKNIPLEFLSPVTLCLKGKNSISTDIYKNYYIGKNFITVGTGIACDDLIITGDGSLEMQASLHCGYWLKDQRDLTIYGGNIKIYYGYLCSEGKLTINGGDIFMGTRTEKEYSAARIFSRNIIINGGSVNVKNNTNFYEAIEGEAITINGGSVTAEKDSWSYQGDPCMTAAIGGYCKINKEGISGSDTVAAPIIINGGTVTAIVESSSVSAAIGIRGIADEGYKKYDSEKMAALAEEASFKLVMTGGTLKASKLKGRSTDVYFPSQVVLDEVTGGTVFDGSKQVFKKPDCSPPAAVPVLTPDIFEYVDERPDYKVIDGFEMMRVRKGKFMMGATEDQGWDVNRNEKPAHEVTLTRDYYICLYPVTQKQWTDIMGGNPAKHRSNFFDLQTQLQWAAVLGAHPSRFAGNDFYPVECVSHINAREFIAALNRKTGKNFRLPTEAEWEFAARGGVLSKGFMYAGSNNLKEVATLERTGSNMEATPTAIKDCNELGIYDMSGSVKEWVNDVKGDYTEEAKTDPAGPEEPSGGKIDKNILDGSVAVKAAIAANARDIRALSGASDMPERVVRGKGRNAARYEQDEHRKYSDIGFRLVLTTD